MPRVGGRTLDELYFLRPIPSEFRHTVRALMATALRHDPIVQLGEFLRTARERAGLTLQQVSNTTKIPQRHLDAIEHGDLSVVPKGPYRRGEVRAFAEAVGVDQNVALARLNEALPATPPETPIPVVVEPVEPQSSWGAAITLLLAVVGLVTLVMWNRDAASTVTDDASSLPPSAIVAPQEDAGPQTAMRQAPAAVTTPANEDPAEPTTSPVLVVTSDPPGARVVVDGIGRGTTPARIAYLSLGEKTIRVVRDGYVSQERTVSLTPNRRSVTLHVQLRQQ